MSATILPFPRRPRLVAPPLAAPPLADGALAAGDAGHRPLCEGDPVIIRGSGIRGTLASLSDAAEYGLDGRMVAIVRTAADRYLPAWPKELARDPHRARQP